MPSREFIRDRGLFTITYNGNVESVDETIFVEGGELYSQDNPFYKRLGRTSADIGGDFFVQRYWTESGSVVKAAGTPYSYHGRMIPNASTNSFPGVSWMRSNELRALGTTALARALPTNSNAGLATAMGELKRDGIPALIGQGLLKKKARDFRELGGEYLNVEFGWKPFISDVQSLAKAAKNYETILQQYRRDHGRKVKRRYEFPETKETTPEPGSWQTPLPGLASGHYLTSTGWQEASTTETVKSWFEGCFTYFIPVGDSHLAQARRYAQEADKLLGLELTPEVLWNLTPWSWAADWVSNIGDIIHNASAFMQDGLVMHYGYMMRHSLATRTIVHDGIRFSNGASTGPLILRQNREIKHRVRASPYGFGLEFDAFTTRQKSIIGALGITRVPPRKPRGYFPYE